MKLSLVFIALLLWQPTFLFTQNAPEVLPDGGGVAPEVSPGRCLSDADRAQIQAAIDANIISLRAEGKMPAEWTEATTVLSWPLEASPELPFQNYYGISGFVDLDNSFNVIQDYACGFRTYDGHQGTDYFTWPFPWYQYENNYVSVIAAAPGFITYRQDGHYDKSCDWNGNQDWNAVYITHADGTTAWYGHLKQYGITDKPLGATVEAGEFLGYVASSGRSSGPHLHLEIKSPSNGTIDPYFGDCDAQTNLVSWMDQGPLREPTINALMTHDAIPVHSCPGSNESPNFAFQFDLGDPIIVGAYFRDQLLATITDYRILAPDGTEVDSWFHFSEGSYNGSWWYWTRNLPASAEAGEYTVEATYEGQVVTRVFAYGVVSGIDDSDLAKNFRLTPNPTSDRIYWEEDVFMASKVAVLDGRGKLIFQRQTENSPNFVDLTTLPKGLYFLRFETEEGSLTRRVVKQ
ncbi:hypothetical protein CEQ90_18505 [Lewinellaceae bacterium SD302]|nr:hypothetical protein CEQ90_18505 [Lewinellaceae bacterium SD302]